MKCSARVVLLSALFTSLASGGCLGSDLIVNGKFADVTGNPAHPFVGWTTDPASGGDVPTAGSTPVTNAVFTESATALFVQLQQSVVIPPTAWLLAFDYLAAGDPGTGEAGGGSPDSFQATLFDRIGNPFAPVSPSSPGFYSVDIGGSDFRGPGVTVSPSQTLAGWTHVELSLAGLPVANDLQPWTLEFLLIGGDDGQTSTVNLTNVEILDRGTAVPEPGSLQLGLLALITTACAGRFRGHRYPAES